VLATKGVQKCCEFFPATDYSAKRRHAAAKYNHFDQRNRTITLQGDVLDLFLLANNVNN